VTEPTPPEGRGAQVPVLEEVVIPGELLDGDLEELLEGGRLGPLVDELVDQAVDDALRQVAAGVKESLCAQLHTMLPALIATLRERSAREPDDADGA
jgi:hypothetical protein